MSDRALRRWLGGAFAVPFVVALVVIGRKGWTPVLDMAMTEFRVRDVGGRHTPLIGLPGRIGRFPEQGSHPGPLSFYLLAPIYRLFGATAFGLLVGAAIINLAAAWGCLWVALRLGGRRMLWAVAAVVAVAMAWLGAGVLTQPWNPYLPLVPFLFVLLCTWAIVQGHQSLLVWQVAVATLCAQTHVPYLSLCVAMVALAFGSVAWRWWRERPAGGRFPARPVGLALGVGSALWLPVFVDQWRRDPGNITMLRKHFLDPPEVPQGLVDGVETVLRRFDLVHLATRLVQRPSFFLDAAADQEGGQWWLGAVLVAAWVAAVVLYRRTGEQRLLGLHVVVGVGTLLGMVSTGRIFGRVWYYLTLWAWLLALLAALATVWTAWRLWAGSPRAAQLGSAAPQGAAATLVALALLAFTIDAAQAEPPEDELGSTLEAVVGPTAAAVRAGVGAADGADGVYMIIWDDAYYFGSQGYGLINELEREGLDARGYPVYRVPVTAHRIVAPADATAEIVLVTGVNIDRWRAIDGVEEVAHHEPRSAAQLDEFARLRTEVLALLADAGRDDLIDLVDTNLFGVTLQLDLPSGVLDRVSRMLLLGQETAVFVASPGTFEANA